MPDVHIFDTMTAANTVYCLYKLERERARLYLCRLVLKSLSSKFVSAETEDKKDKPLNFEPYTRRQQTVPLTHAGCIFAVIKFTFT